MTYRVPVEEMIFTAEKVIGQSRLAETGRFEEATDDMRSAIITEAAKMAEGAMVPVNRDGDLHPARLENSTPPLQLQRSCSRTAPILISKIGTGRGRSTM